MTPKSIMEAYPKNENKLWSFDTWLQAGQTMIDYSNSLEEDDKEKYSKELLYTPKLTIGELLEIKSYFDGFMYYPVLFYKNLEDNKKYLIETRDFGYSSFEELKETLAYFKRQYTHLLLHKISDYTISFSKLNLVSYDNVETKSEG